MCMEERCPLLPESTLASRPQDCVRKWTWFRNPAGLPHFCRLVRSELSWTTHRSLGSLIYLSVDIPDKGCIFLGARTTSRPRRLLTSFGLTVVRKKGFYSLTVLPVWSNLVWLMLPPSPVNILARTTAARWVKHLVHLARRGSPGRGRCRLGSRT